MRTFKQHIQEAPAIAPVLGTKPTGGPPPPQTDPQRAKLDRMRTMARNNPKAASLVNRFSFGLTNKVLADPNKGPDPRQSGTRQRPKALSTDTVQSRGAVTSRPPQSNRGPVLEPDRFRDKYSNISVAAGRSDRKPRRWHDPGPPAGPRHGKTAIFGKKDQFSPRPPNVNAPTDKEIDRELKMIGRDIRSKISSDAEKQRELRKQSAIKSSQRRAKIRERSRKLRARLAGGDALKTSLDYRAGKI